MKKILFSLITLSVILTGCGKDNKTNSGSNTATASTTSASTAIVPSTLTDAINNNSFASTANYRYQKYSFARYITLVEDKCSSKYITCNFSDTDLEYAWEVTSSNLPSLETKKAELIAIVNSASSVDNTYSSSGVIDVYTAEGVGYRFNLRLPIYANPILKVDYKNSKITQLTNMVLY